MNGVNQFYKSRQPFYRCGFLNGHLTMLSFFIAIDNTDILSAVHVEIDGWIIPVLI